MTPPDAAQGDWHNAGAPDAAPAVSVCPQAIEPKPTMRSTPMLPYVRHGVLNVLPERSDFLKAASARRQGTGSFLLQARARRDDNPLVRIGFTASKKVGNAVFRARAKRRLRAIAAELLPALGQPGWDYVLVAKPGATVSRDFQLMLEDLRQAMVTVHRDRPPGPRREGAKPGPKSAEAKTAEAKTVEAKTGPLP